MGTTPNLGLPVYGSSDTPDWMDTNNGFEKLDNIVGGAANVHLDFANPLYTFDATHLEYTAVKDCYLYGTIIGQENAQFNIRINGTKVAGGFVSTNSSYPTISFSPLLLREGDVVTVSALDPTYTYRDCLGVYEGEIVSDTFVWNEAIVELDYTTPLHSFTSGNLSYTATKRCWLVGSAVYGEVTINGTKIAYGCWSSPSYASTSVFLPLNVGDVVTCANAETWLKVLDGEIKGSAPGNSGGGDILELLDIANAVTLTTTNYTTPKAGCIVGGTYHSADNVKIILDDDTAHPLTQTDGSTRSDIFIPGIPKGSRLKLNISNSSIVSFVPYKYESIAPEITVYNEAEVELDYANPLYTFTRNTSSQQTYTATQDCYLVGNFATKGTNAPADITINNTPIACAISGTNDCVAPFIFLKLKTGDIVNVPDLRDYGVLQVLKGTISGSVGQLNPAPKPDYNNCLYEANPMVSSGTYTATQDCYARCGGENSQDGVGYFKVNDHVVNKVYGPTTMFSQCELDLQKGDVLTWSNIGTTTGYVSVFAYR